MRVRYVYIILVLFVGGYLSFKFAQIFGDSLFFKNKDRINMVIYGQQSALYSIDTNESRHYVLYFPPDLKMQVPGGYGNYRVGSLGKLAKLDGNQDIYRKTFAFATTAFVDYYFYPAGQEVYYGEKVSKTVTQPSFFDFIKYRSNASIVDRIYLLLTFFRINQADITLIDYLERTNSAKKDIFFQEESFKQESIGLLFQKKYRTEHKSVQILYDDRYQVAKNIASLLEGNGIRVNDISINFIDKKKCLLIEDRPDSNQFSSTVVDMADYFDCSIVKGKTDVYDIIFVLGNIEDDWEVV